MIKTSVPEETACLWEKGYHRFQMLLIPMILGKTQDGAHTPEINAILVNMNT